MNDTAAQLTAHSLTARIDARSGLPATLSAGHAGSDLTLTGGLRVIHGGDEVRGPFGGLAYEQTTTSQAFEASEVNVSGGEGQVVLHSGGVQVVLRYHIRAEHPRLSLDIEVHAPQTVRNVLVDLHLAAPPHWGLAAPGNRIRPGMRVGDLTTPLAVNGVMGTAGSTGLISLEDPAGTTFLLWPWSSDGIGSAQVSPAAGGLDIEIDTQVAGAPAADGATHVACRTLLLDALPSTWEQVRAEIPSWYEGLGLRLPARHPEWTGSPSMFEVQIGTSLFGGVADYSPYPTAADLLADLPRIQDLGFDTIQIMPRQPYPSYNVADWFDIDAGYGDAGDLRELVRQAHERGMRVILDVLMHGVIDQEIITTAADAVRSGPHGEFLRTHTFYSIEDTYGLPAPDRVPWSKHILDFEAAWHDGSPPVHPLTIEHPEWFCTDSSGDLIGVYTKAFDLGNQQWQRYFLQALRFLIAELGVDGFRFDAPTYNRFANYSPAAREHASATSTASLGLFRMLRAELTAEHPDLMFYTEPSGVLLRESMDLSYNYDEHAQLEDLLGGGGAALGGIGASGNGVRTARELAQWMSERDALLPPGSATAHHIDSHDTFWWPRPGMKWRREQYGLPVARALASIFALSGGAYMTFVGGELGMEHHLQAIHRLRRRPEIAAGEADFAAVRHEHEDLYAVVRRSGENAALVLVSLAPVPLPATLALPDAAQLGSVDLLTGEQIAVSAGDGGWHVSLRPHQSIVLPINRSRENTP